jgi:hypothetical protein
MVPCFLDFFPNSPAAVVVAVAIAGVGAIAAAVAALTLIVVTNIFGVGFHSALPLQATRSTEQVTGRLLQDHRSSINIALPKCTGKF